MSSLEIGLLLIVCYICVFSIITRICDCVERCSIARYQNKIIIEEDNVSENKD